MSQYESVYNNTFKKHAEEFGFTLLSREDFWTDDSYDEYCRAMNSTAREFLIKRNKKSGKILKISP